MATKLELAAIAQRAILTTPNSYKQDWNNPTNVNDQYSPTHTRALADTTTPEYGKGTGGFLDTNNYNAGGEFDKNGYPSILGSGRNNAIIQNQAQWGYGPTQVYGIPDTSGNAGQYHMP
jgi:hypothetical protein